MKYIEKMGSGFISLFDAFKEANLKSPVVIEGTNYIKCILPRESDETKSKHIHEKIIALFLNHEQISRSDIVKLLHIPKTTAGRLLDELLNQGKIKRMGKGRSTHYVKM